MDRDLRIENKKNEMKKVTGIGAFSSNAKTPLVEELNKIVVGRTK